MNQVRHLEDEIHIWKHKIGEQQNGKALSILSNQELNQFHRFISDASRTRYASAHIFLRTILARYTGMEPNEIQFEGKHNKKLSLKENTEHPVFFNLSYRDAYALVALAPVSAVGVDVERVCEIHDFSRFVTEFFSEEERKRIFETPCVTDRLSMLFTLWAMKESLVKALAKGLSEPLCRYNLCKFLQRPVGVPDFDTTPWLIREIDVEENYRAACAVQSDRLKVKVFDYDFD